MQVPPPLIEAARALAEDVLSDHVTDDSRARARHLIERLPRPAPDKPDAAARESRDAAAREAWNEYVAWVRAKVWFLSASKCEHCFKFLGADRGDLDHVNGGADRRASTSIDGTRRLCRHCHHSRTLNRPSTDYWKAQFEDVKVARTKRHGKDVLDAIREEELDRLRAVLDLRPKPHLTPPHPPNKE